MSSLNRIITFAVFLFVLSICVDGQDLGSSNKILSKSRKTSKSSNPVEKPSAKPKSKTSQPKSAGKKAKKNSTSDKSSTIQPQSAPKIGTGSKSGARFTEFREASSSTIEVAKPSATVSVAAANRYEELIDNGNSARDERNYVAAESAYREAKGINPADSRAVYGLGNIFSDQQRWEEAEIAYRSSLLVDPTNSISIIALSYVLTQPIAAPNLSERYEEAEKLARMAIELSPSNALAFDQLGVALELRGLIRTDTENAYRRAIQLDPSFAPAYAHLGRLLRRRGLNQESATAYQSAIQRSTDVATMILVADVMQSEQRFADSEPLLRKALESDPKNPAGLHLLGRSLTIQAKYLDAEQVLRSSLSVSPNTYIANSLLASLYTRQGKLDLAENALLQALRSVSSLEKRNLSFQFETVGDGYLKTGKARNAERTYRQAIALDPDKESLTAKLLKAQRG